MLMIPCPWCGTRTEDEFAYVGEADRKRPKDPAALSDEAWTDYLFNRDNLRGPTREWWHHAHGCGHWFVIERDTGTHAISPDETNGS